MDLIADPSEGAGYGTAISLLKAAVLAASLFIAFTYPFSLLLGIYVMYEPRLGLEYLKHPTQVYFISYMIMFSTPFRVGRAFLFASLTIVYFASLWASARIGRGFMGAIRKPWMGFSSFSENWLLFMPTASGMLLILVSALQGIQESIGIPTGSISFPNPYSGLLSLAYSPVAEEIGFRLTPIGTVTALYLIKYGKPREALLSILWPDKGKEVLGLPTIQGDGLKGVAKPEWVAAAASSAFFGAVHYIAGGGWDVGKISSAALAGMALALIYLWRGIHASILLHWFFNYYSYVWDVAKTLNTQLFTGLEAAIYVATIFLGFLGWIRLLWKAYGKLRRGGKERKYDSCMEHRDVCTGALKLDGEVFKYWTGF
ncbi:MAG: CPBP family glutamic-type intramembrane protease [Candidatus Bathyarchaeia archaeon]